MNGPLLDDSDLIVSAGDGISVSDTEAGSASATIGFENDGDITSTITAGLTDEGDWVSPKGAAAALGAAGWTIRAHVDSGALTGGSAEDTDLALTSSRSWIVAQSGSGGGAATLTITIKDGAGVTRATGTVSLSATVP